MADGKRNSAPWGKDTGKRHSTSGRRHRSRRKGGNGCVNNSVLQWRKQGFLVGAYIFTYHPVGLPHIIYISISLSKDVASSGIGWPTALAAVVVNVAELNVSPIIAEYDYACVCAWDMYGYDLTRCMMTSNTSEISEGVDGSVCNTSLHNGVSK